MRIGTLGVVVVGLVGCGPTVDETPVSGTSGGGSSSSTSTGTREPASTSTSSDASTGNREPGTTEDEGGSSSGVVVPEDCDVFAQDCPPGYKCAPYSNDGDVSLDDTRCVPVLPDPAGIGETCTPSASGLDECDVGQLCWNFDPETQQGECIELCGGSPEEPVCLQQPEAVCIISADGVVTPCLLPCDPLGDDCDAGELCVPAGPSFICAPDAAPDTGALGEPCEFINVCDPGLGCLAPVEGVCDEPLGAGCCLPYCSLSAPGCPEGLGCLPWWEEGDAPEGFEDVGACHVMP